MMREEQGRVKEERQQLEIARGEEGMDISIYMVFVSNLMLN